MIYDPKRYLRGVADTYAEEIEGGLDFWAEHGVDWEKGGLVTYLDREGNWYLDEKQGWFTGRAMYSFARGYNDFKKKQKWLDAALNLYDFLIAHQFIPGENGKLYHNMDRDGNPCSPHPKACKPGASWNPSLHDESFAVMGLAELYRATGREDVKQTLYRLFNVQQFIFRNPDFFKNGKLSPKDMQPKVGLGTLMSLLCSVQTLRQCDPDREAMYTECIATYIDEVFKYYYIPERKLLTEQEVDCPGHSMEVAWFMLAEGMYTKNQELINTCADIVMTLFDMGWDKQYGGFIVLMNFEGRAAFDICGNLKYWWPNNELLIGLMYSYIGTGRIEFLERYRQVHEWVFAHFPDREHGEWYGYLNHDGTPLSHTKGDNQKGPYHLYRSFYAIKDLIETYLAKE